MGAIGGFRREFLGGTGMRIGEALGVRTEVIDLEAGVLEVAATAVRLNATRTAGRSRPAWKLPD